MSQLRAPAAQQLLEALRESQALTAALGTSWQDVEACQQLRELLEAVTVLLAQLFGRYRNTLFLEGLNSHLQASAQLLHFGLLKVARLVDVYCTNPDAESSTHCQDPGSTAILASLYAAATSAAADIQLAVTVLVTAVQYLEATQTLQQAEAAAVHHITSTNITELLQDSAARVCPAGMCPAGGTGAGQSPAGLIFAGQVAAGRFPAEHAAGQTAVSLYECETETSADALLCVEHAIQLPIPDSTETAAAGCRNHDQEQGMLGEETRHSPQPSTDDVKPACNHTPKSAVVGEQKQLQHAGTTPAREHDHSSSSAAIVGTRLDSSEGIRTNHPTSYHSESESTETTLLASQQVMQPETKKQDSQLHQQPDEQTLQSKGGAGVASPFAGKSAPCFQQLQSTTEPTASAGRDGSPSNCQAGKHQKQHQGQQSAYDAVRLQVLRELLVPGSTWSAAEDGANFRIMSQSGQVVAAGAADSTSFMETHQQVVKQQKMIAEGGATVNACAAVSDICMTAAVATATAKAAGSPAGSTFTGTQEDGLCKQQQLQQEEHKPPHFEIPAGSTSEPPVVGNLASSWLQHQLQQVYNNPLLQGPKQLQQRHALLRRSLEISSGTAPPTNLQGYAVGAAAPVDKTSGSGSGQQQQQSGQRRSASGSGYSGRCTGSTRYSSSNAGYNESCLSSSRGPSCTGINVRRSASACVAEQLPQTLACVAEAATAELAEHSRASSEPGCAVEPVIAGFKRRASGPGSARGSTEQMIRDLLGDPPAAAASSTASDTGVLGPFGPNSSSLRYSMRDSLSSTDSYAAAAAAKRRTASVSSSGGRRSRSGVLTSGSVQEQSRSSSKSSSRGRSRGALITSVAGASVVQLLAGATAAAAATGAGTASAAGSSGGRGEMETAVQQQLHRAIRSSEAVCGVAVPQSFDARESISYGTGSSSRAGSGVAADVEHTLDDNMRRSSNSIAEHVLPLHLQAPKSVDQHYVKQQDNEVAGRWHLSNSSSGGGACVHSDIRCSHQQPGSSNAAAGNSSNGGSSSRSYLDRYMRTSSRPGSAGGRISTAAAAAAASNNKGGENVGDEDVCLVQSMTSAEPAHQSEGHGADNVTAAALVNDNGATGCLATASPGQQNSMSSRSGSSILHIARSSSSTGGVSSSSCGMRIRRLSSSAAAEAAVRKCSSDVDAWLQQQQQRWQQQWESAVPLSDVWRQHSAKLRQEQQQWEEQQHAWHQCHHDLSSFDCIDGNANIPRHLLPSTAANSSSHHQQQQQGHAADTSLLQASDSMLETTAAVRDSNHDATGSISKVDSSQASRDGETGIAHTQAESIQFDNHNSEAIEHDSTTDKQSFRSSLMMLSSNGAAAAPETLQAAAQSLLAAGNAAYTNGSYAVAAKLYRSAMDKLADQRSSSNSFEGMQCYNGHNSDDMVVTKCKLNLACCHLRMGQYRQCLAECDAILDVDPFNVVALCHRGRALLMTQQPQAAAEDLDKAQELLAEEATAQQQQVLATSTAAAGPPGGRVYVRPMSPSTLAKVKLNNEYWQQRVNELLKQL